jgi:hypothetical protein
VRRTASPLGEALLARVLAPYRATCRYVLDAVCEHPLERRAPQPDDPSSWIAIDSNCHIPASCYIDDTGHFNAVELNISYNQMLYAGLAAVAERGLIAELRHWDLEAFFRHQLPDVLIIDYHARFPRPLDPRAFRGRFEIREVIDKPHKNMVLLRTVCHVRSEPDGHAEASVVIALVHV